MCLEGRVSSYTVKTDHNYWRPYECFARNGVGSLTWVQRHLPEPKED